MTNEEFRNLKIGDVVELINHGQNKGKKGIVRDIKRDAFGTGIAYLEPLDCEFLITKYRRSNSDGFYGWNKFGIGYPKKEHNREFYISETFGGDGVSWPANNFTLEELKTIERFLKEFKEKVEGLSLEEIEILYKD